LVRKLVKEERKEKNSLTKKMKGPKNDENGTEELLAEKKVFRFVQNPSQYRKKDTYLQT